MLTNPGAVWDVFVQHSLHKVQAWRPAGSAHTSLGVAQALLEAQICMPNPGNGQGVGPFRQQKHAADPIQWCDGSSSKKVNPDFRHGSSKDLHGAAGHENARISLISEYFDRGQFWEVVRACREMREEGVKPNMEALVCAVKACSGLRDLEAGKDIHACMMEAGSEMDAFEANTVMDMYVKCGSMVDARKVFEHMPARNVVSWNIIILGYAKKGDGARALELYARMQQEGFEPSERNFLGALKACSSLAALEEEGAEVDGTVVKMGCLEKGRGIHSQVVDWGFQSNVFVGNTLIDMYVKCGSIVDACHVFYGLPRCDVVSWNSMILGYAQKEQGDEAVQLYAQMQQQGVSPNDRTFVAALKACSSLAVLEQGSQGLDKKVGCLEKGRAIHSEAVKGGFDANVFVGTTLVGMYAKCGSMVDARHVFDDLCRRNVVTWNAMILGYAENQESELALELYAQMHREGVLPDDRTFVGALKACGNLAAAAAAVDDGDDGKLVKVQCLEKGKAIHLQAAKHGLESDAFVGSTLVNMYAKCGSMADARRVFDTLPHHHVVSRTAMMLWHVDNGEGEAALELYAQLQQEGGAQDDRTFVAALKACSSLADLEKGRAVHCEAVKHGFDSDAYVGNTLIDMYVKCGSIVDARHVFDRLSHRDVVCWNAMILGYAHKEHCEVALRLYAQMQQQGVASNDRTFVGALKACSSLATREERTEVDGKFLKLGCLEKGKSIHTQVLKMGLERDPFVGTRLVDTYAKCGAMEDAQHVFHRLPRWSVAAWTAMISGHADNDLGDVALELYTQMQREGIMPNNRTFASALKACTSLATLEDGQEVDGKLVRLRCLQEGRAIHSQIVKCGFESDVFVGNTLMDMYAKCGSIVDARNVFNKLRHHRDVVSWNVMILGYAENEEGDSSLLLYAQMQQDGVLPNDRTFLAALKACSSLAVQEDGKQVDGCFVKMRSLERGRAIHSHVIASGWSSDVFVGTTLVDMYVKCGSMVDARHVFDQLPHRDLVSWNAMMLGYSEQQGGSVEAFKLLSQMEQQGLSPDTLTFVSILKACANVAALENGKEVHAQIRRLGLETTSIVATTLIDMYGECGSMVEAQKVFDGLPTRDTVTWNALIAGYAGLGDSEAVFHLFHRMKQEGWEPDEVTLLSVLTVCSHAGLVEQGQTYFEYMTKNHTMRSTIEHHTCMVDLLGRAGQVEEAVDMLKRFPFQPTLVAWWSIMGACRKWNNVDVGRHAFESAVRLDEKHAAAYVLMSNIYEDAHMWEDRNFIQAMRKKAQAWKSPGQSWSTDCSGIMHIFEARDQNHPESLYIHEKLKSLQVEMEDKRALVESCASS